MLFLHYDVKFLIDGSEIFFSITRGSDLSCDRSSAHSHASSVRRSLRTPSKFLIAGWSS